MALTSVDILKIRLTSCRLLLRPVLLKFKREIFREFTDEITTYMYPSTPEYIEETEEFIENSIAHMKQGTELVVAILNKKTKEFLGCGGIHKINTPHPELGIWIKKSAHGHGYGREAVATLKRWADAHLQHEYCVYPVSIQNTASRKIVESLGGTVARKMNKKKAGGRVLQEVEYRMY